MGPGIGPLVSTVPFLKGMAKENRPDPSLAEDGFAQLSFSRAALGPVSSHLKSGLDILCHKAEEGLNGILWGMGPRLFGISKCIQGRPPFPLLAFSMVARHSASAWPTVPGSPVALRLRDLYWCTSLLRIAKDPLATGSWAGASAPCS